MNEIINSSTLRQGAAPWNTEIVSFNQNVRLDLWGQSASDIIKIRRVRVQEGTITNTSNQTCCITPATKAVVKSSKIVLRCDCNGSYPAELSTNASSIILSDGDYVFEYSGSGFAAKTTVLTYKQTNKESCDCDCFSAPVAAAPSVTATVSICPVPACFTWGGAQYTSITAFVADVKALVPSAGYNPITCTFSAPAGSVFPSLTIVACVPVPVIPAYCPSLRLDVCDCNEIGFAYRDGDSKDPAATVPILACDGTTVGYAYPTPRVGATVPYEENDVVIGYLQNRSNCAPEASTVINNYHTTNVAAPVVNNEFAPTTNVANAFAPTTNVAAPTVVLPAPTVASQTLDANDAIVTTLTNGTVFTTPLSNC